MINQTDFIFVGKDIDCGMYALSLTKQDRKQYIVKLKYFSSITLDVVIKTFITKSLKEAKQIRDKIKGELDG